MGFLDEYTPMTWEEALPRLRYVRDHGIEQFIHLFQQVKDIEEDLLRWGDELEYSVLKLEGKPDDPNRKVKISLRGPEILQDLKDADFHGKTHGLSQADTCNWLPEYGRWMLEATPAKPFEGINALLRVEDHMRLRRSRVLSVLEEDEILPTMASFPMMGVGKPSDWCHNPHCSKPLTTRGPIANSMFVPDEIINPHPRFGTLTKNIRARRGSNVCIKRPKFKDVNSARHPSGTAKKKDESTNLPQTPEEADNLVDNTYADAMAFGMGCCCLQVTFQAGDISQSRHLYDQLAAFTPILLALTAASPFLRGWLLAEDVRWTVVSQSVDDRTAWERGDQPVNSEAGDSRLAGKGMNYLRKSRYSSIDCFICNCKNGSDPNTRAKMHNDVRVSCEQRHVNRLMESGVDELLAFHVAHLFSRDPLCIFKERVDLPDREVTDHWENLQSTNWQSLRWKPPPPRRGMLENTSEEHVGWRVEFRTMEIQMTDYENAAFTVFVVLLSRVLIALKINTYMPMSKLEENMRLAHKRDAVNKEKFWFRKDVFPSMITQLFENNAEEGDINQNEAHHGHEESHDHYIKMTIQELLCGIGGKGADHDTHPDIKQREFCGWVKIINLYLDFVGVDCVTRDMLNKYIDFIVKRASGELKTNAQWILDFIKNHPSYKGDSKIPTDTAYDLAVAMKEIGEGVRRAPEILGDVVIPLCTKGANPMKNTADDRPLLSKYLEYACSVKMNSIKGELCQKREMADALRREMDELSSKLLKQTQVCRRAKSVGAASNISERSSSAPRESVASSKERFEKNLHVSEGHPHHFEHPDGARRFTHI